MPKTIEGQLDATGMKFGVVISRFNSFITARLLDGVMDAILRHGGADENVTVAWVPGAFETPLVARKMAETGGYDVIIAVGAVIRGGTPHFDYVASESAKGIAQASMETGVPIIYGIITTDNIEQAVERAGAKLTNRGFEAAVSAIETVNVIRGL